MKSCLQFTCLIPLAFTFHLSSAQLKITPLTKDFYVYTTYQNFGGEPFPSNSLYLVTNEGVVLIDTPWDTAQFQPLLDSIDLRHGKEVVHCIATHSHEDRTGGLEYYRSLGIKTYTSKMTDDISRKTGQKRAEFLFENDTTFTVGQYSFKIFYFGPGHTKDNIVVWFPEQKIIYAGCLIKSTEANNLGNIADADLEKYPETLRKLKFTLTSYQYVIPGHQDWTDSRSIDHTLELLKAQNQKK